MADRIYYCICSSGCKFETMTKEQILAAITQAVNEGTIGDIDTGFVTTLKEQNSQKGVSLWVGTQAQYNAIAAEDIKDDCLYIITDDNEIGAINEAIEEIKKNLEDINAGKCRAVYADKAGAVDTSTDIEPRGVYFMLFHGNDGKVFSSDSYQYDADSDTIYGNFANAQHADTADYATNANHAYSADTATSAEKADMLSNTNGFTTYSASAPLIKGLYCVDVVFGSDHYTATIYIDRQNYSHAMLGFYANYAFMLVAESSGKIGVEQYQGGTTAANQEGKFVMLTSAHSGYIAPDSIKYRRIM